ncbi:Kinesin-related motor protein [Komagataella phaffii CBS 7435]|uniref:Kinesin-like protein n=2 Tax=Komagataella phaffii TaxID=460519 RepID=C4QW20_KOMPG|nr:Kinesin-related motor protein involved in mitotic spindle positioning [Komagataella phaffii GS115]AOA60589.1 GQ67_02652T0 [Komagataella phaffii]CAH2446109.1 Kinesin-related motor protein [Komagataella phaffii CBS 7435]AOA65420.1 GQ68_02596T0 [Komagataella phaffii GS115]CAY67443.1 Kinesin-related motor protein involved in mitotic spindle positioning [Komagataella phaffii GS115]CCA36542.1 Kinesin-related motor protein [Komagataella phaffii CBS 7435]
MTDSSSGLARIKVFTRVRPLIGREIENGNNSCIVEMPDQHTTVWTSRHSTQESKRFQFHRSLWSFEESDPHYVSQDALYQLIGQDMLNNCLNGYNSCIFAYGQTGSGKTYTMMGNKLDGLVPSLGRELFILKQSMLEKQNALLHLKISFCEIYNEVVYDLLSNDNVKLRVRETKNHTPYVENLQEFPLKDFEELMSYLKRGSMKRKTASTIANKTSSRSHSIFTIILQQERYLDENLTKHEKLESHLRLVDLAGSERTNVHNEARFKEGSHINKSLTTLGRILTILSNSSSRRGTKGIPYRESVLTWLLKESIGGNSQTAMISCLSPTEHEETLSTLRYSETASKITNVVTQNKSKVELEGDLQQLVSKQEEENMKLLQFIEKLQKGDSGLSTKKYQVLRNRIKYEQKYIDSLMYKTNLTKKLYFERMSAMEEYSNELLKLIEVHNKDIIRKNRKIHEIFEQGDETKLEQVPINEKEVWDPQVSSMIEKYLDEDVYAL